MGKMNTRGQHKLGAYMATALSGLTDTERQHVNFLSGAVDEVCKKYSINLYQPRMKTDPVNHPDVPDEKVYEIDRSRVALSDLMFMLCDYASTGAGMEYEMATQVGIPVVLLSLIGKKISRIIPGGFANTHRVTYEDPENLKEKLDSLLSNIVPEIVEVARYQRQHKDFRIGTRLRKLRHEKNIEVTQLAQRIGVKSSYLEALEEHEERVSNPSIYLLRRIALEMGISISDLVDGEEKDVSFEVLLQRSAVNFVTGKSLTRDFVQPLVAKHMVFINGRTVGVMARSAIPSEEKWEEYYQDLCRERGQGRLF